MTVSHLYKTVSEFSFFCLRVREICSTSMIYLRDVDPSGRLGRATLVGRGHEAAWTLFWGLESEQTYREVAVVGAVSVAGRSAFEFAFP
jgi:hypothetical protein